MVETIHRKKEAAECNRQARGGRVGKYGVILWTEGQLFRVVRGSHLRITYFILVNKRYGTG